MFDGDTGLFIMLRLIYDIGRADLPELIYGIARCIARYTWYGSLV